jgi:hypothetical protein
MGETGLVKRVVNAVARKLCRWPAAPSTASLCGQELFARVFKHPSRSVTYAVNGINLQARAYHINNSAARELGINPSLLRGGAEVLVVSRRDFEKYGGTIGADPKNLAGVYAPKGAGEIQRVLAAQQKTLSPGARRVLVPDDASALTLCHEILHDLFHSWNLSDPHSERVWFTRLTVAEAYRVAVRFPGSDAARFFAGIAARCAEPYDLKRITGSPVPQMLALRQGLAFTEETQAFVAEVFAYGGSMAIFSRMSAEHSEKELGEVPAELKAYFERAVVHPRLLH